MLVVSQSMRLNVPHRFRAHQANSLRSASSCSLSMVLPMSSPSFAKLRRVTPLTSLQARLMLAVALLSLVIGGGVATTVATVSRNDLKAQAHADNERRGDLILARLAREVLWAESLVQAIADYAASQPFDDDAFRTVIPTLFDGNPRRHLIAGGGVWPEANAFEPGVDRRSLFWGRDNRGQLKFVDDYNTPDGPGYRGEEWYVPARHLAPRTCYWSRSYMDPYTYEPMVTCTAPMVRGTAFIGVATTDLRLSVLAAVLDDVLGEQTAYAFLVDREERFLTFPDNSLVKHQEFDASGGLVDEFIRTDDLVPLHPPFLPIATALNEQRDLRSTHFAKQNGDFRDLTVELAEASYQISPSQAEVIASCLLAARVTDGADVAPGRRLETDQDLFIAEPVSVSIVRMPQTDWTLVMVTPASQIVASANLLVRNLMISVGLVTIAAIGAAMLLLRGLVIRPLNQMSAQLEIMNGEDDENDGTPRFIDYPGQNELGLLSDHFNRRTRALIGAREAARVASQAKSEFLTNMSHELRTPMTAILGYADLLNDPRTDAEERAEYVQTIRRNGDHLLQIINDVLDLSRIEAGRLALDPRDVAVHELVQGVAQLMQVRATSKDLHLTVEIDPDTPAVVHTDPLRVRQILVNLVGNAIKFTEEGCVQISVSYQAGATPQLCLEVIDTGIGIDQNTIQKLFMPFSQGDTSVTREYGGAGLGLLISQRLATMLGGSIQVSSDPGRGSTFTARLAVTLPEEEEFETAALSVLPATPIEPPGADSPEPLAGRRILLVEDGRDTRQLVARNLRLAGAEVAFAANGAEALDTVRNRGANGEAAPFDLIVMDMQMPAMDGYDATRRLRDYGCRIPILALTAHAMEGDRERCLKAGCDAYLAKPVDASRFVRRCREEIDQGKKTSPHCA